MGGGGIILSRNLYISRETNFVNFKLVALQNKEASHEGPPEAPEMPTVKLR